MVFSGAMNFCKQLSCPTAETIVAYQLEALPASVRAEDIALHLGNCEFCGAESQLLSRSALDDKQGEEQSAATEIPLHLVSLFRELIGDGLTRVPPPSREPRGKKVGGFSAFRAIIQFGDA